MQEFTALKKNFDNVLNDAMNDPYFLDEKGEVDVRKVEDWISKEKLQMGFTNGVISKENVIPLTSTAKPYYGKRLKTRSELEEALNYMISFLELREKEFGGDLND